MSCGWIAGVRRCLLIQELMTSFMLIQFLASTRIGIAFFIVFENVESVLVFKCF